MRRVGSDSLLPTLIAASRAGLLFAACQPDNRLKRIHGCAFVRGLRTVRDGVALTGGEQLAGLTGGDHFRLHIGARARGGDVEYGVATRIGLAGSEQLARRRAPIT